MFTGIVERAVRVAAVADVGQTFRRLTLVADWPDVRPGDSIAVNGCCLTVAEIGPGTPGQRLLGFDAIPETLARTNLGLLKAGDVVHVERAMRVGDRFDGHFVQGHIDGPATLVATHTAGPEWRLRLRVPADLYKFVTPKGSVCLDGVSLTVASICGSDEFEVALIPTTLNLTQLGKRGIGWPFNFEADVLAKTVVSYLERTGPGVARG